MHNSRIDWNKIEESIKENTIRKAADAHRADMMPDDAATVLPETELNRYLRNTQGRGNFFKFFRDIARFLGNDIILAAFLQDLMNREVMIHKKCRKHMRRHQPDRCKRSIDNNGFFSCSRSFLAKEVFLPWTEDQQKRYLGGLNKLGLVEILMKKKPRRRWVRINYVRIEQILDLMSGGPNMRKELD